jgi:hypothetical protein
MLESWENLRSEQRSPKRNSIDMSSVQVSGSTVHGKISFGLNAETRLRNSLYDEWRE